MINNIVGKFPRYVKFTDTGIEHRNICFKYIGGSEYQKCYGGWTIKVRVDEVGRIKCNPDYPEVMHLKNRYLIACTEEELEADKEYLHK